MFLKERKRSGFKRSPSGWICVFLLVWLPLAGTVTGNNFLFLTLSLLIGFVALSRRLGKKNLDSISVARVFPEDVFARTPFEVKYLVKSSNARSGATNFSISEEKPVTLLSGPLYASQTPPGASLALNAGAELPRRGEYSIGPTIVSSNFPFGLANRWQASGESIKILVYPELTPLDDFILHQAQTHGAKLERRDIFGSIPYVFREYVPGDPYKRIQWKISARLGKLHVQEYSEESAGRFTIRLPGNPSELAISRAASLIWALCPKGIGITLQGPDFVMGPDHGPVYAKKLLKTLTLWENRPKFREQSPGAERATVFEIDPNGSVQVHQPGEKTNDAA
jgi:uncharacterized protein (DUF58 family)